MTQPLTAEWDFHVEPRSRGRKTLQEGQVLTAPSGRVPRVSRLMALAIRFEGLLQDGVVKDYADLGRLGQVTRARITQIMNLRLLAPELQEDLLYMPRVLRGRDPISLADLQRICLTPDWVQQRRLWQRLRRLVEPSTALGEVES